MFVLSLSLVATPGFRESGFGRSGVEVALPLFSLALFLGFFKIEEALSTGGSVD